LFTLSFEGPPLLRSHAPPISDRTLSRVTILMLFKRRGTLSSLGARRLRPRKIGQVSSARDSRKRYILLRGMAGKRGVAWWHSHS
jgi:hypothetical protein